MIFYIIGIDHKIIPRSKREEASRLRQKIADYWSINNPDRATLLITCNRVEIHGMADNEIEAKAQKDRFCDMFRDQFDRYYALCGVKEVFRYGLRLACGLESQLQGESEIVSQLELWRKEANFPESLDKIWALIMRTAGDIRIRSGLDRSPVSVVTPLFNEVVRDLQASKDPDIMVIGTGKIAELIAGYGDVGKISFVARKRRSRAERFACLTGGKALLPEDIPEGLSTADAVISATSSPHYSLTRRHFSKVLRKKDSALYIYDMAIPADVDPDVKRIPFVVLKDLDYLAGRYLEAGCPVVSELKLASDLIEEKVKELDEYEYSDQGHKAGHASQLISA